jgi:hypothetical protein
MKTALLLLATGFSAFTSVSLHAGAGELGDALPTITKPAAPKLPKTPEPKLALKVPGKDGWIQSPYDGKILDASDFPSGSLVRDPSSGKIMRVP